MKLKAFPLRSGTRQWCPFSLLLFVTILELLAMTIREEKGIKGIQTGKDEKKLLLFTDDSVLCIENTKVTIRKSLELISEFSKFAGYINNTQKSLAILYTKNKKNQRN